MYRPAQQRGRRGAVAREAPRDADLALRSVCYGRFSSSEPLNLEFESSKFLNEGGLS